MKKWLTDIAPMLGGRGMGPDWVAMESEFQKSQSTSVQFIRTRGISLDMRPLIDGWGGNKHICFKI